MSRVMGDPQRERHDREETRNSHGSHLNSTESPPRIIVGEPVRTESAWGERARSSDASPAPLADDTLTPETASQSAEALGSYEPAAWAQNGRAEACATKRIKGMAVDVLADQSPYTRW